MTNRHVVIDLDRIWIETQLREEVESAQLEWKLAAACAEFSGEQKQMAIDHLEHALQRLTDCIIRGVVPVDMCSGKLADAGHGSRSVV